MQDFDVIEKLWNTHSVEVRISSDEMLAQAKKEVNGLKRRSALNIFLMLVSVAAIGGLWFIFDFAELSTHAGIAITLLSVLIYTFILYNDHKLISRNDFTVHPQEFLARLKLYQESRYRLYNRIYWFYVVSLSVGIGLYFIEILRYFSTEGKWITVILTTAWMIFCSTLVRRAVIRKEKERIALLIEKFERISRQF